VRRTFGQREAKSADSLQCGSLQLGLQSELLHETRPTTASARAPPTNLRLCLAAPNYALTFLRLFLSCCAAGHCHSWHDHWPAAANWARGRTLCFGPKSHAYVLAGWAQIHKTQSAQLQTGPLDCRLSAGWAELTATGRHSVSVSASKCLPQCVSVCGRKVKSVAGEWPLVRTLGSRTQSPERNKAPSPQRPEVRSGANCAAELAELAQWRNHLMASSS